LNLTWMITGLRSNGASLTGAGMARLCGAR
jgi:hypothetical protein